MARRGEGYGSEDNLLRYRGQHPDTLDAAIRSAISREGGFEWLYPGSAPFLTSVCAKRAPMADFTGFLSKNKIPNRE